MIRFLKRFHKGERGQALAIVLILLALGGMVVATSLEYTTASLKGGQIINDGLKGVYAAGAGVEYAVWSLAGEVSPPAQLSENVNQRAVSIQTEEKGSYTLYLGELVEPGIHFDYLDVDGDMLLQGGQVYRYTITVTWQTGSGYSTIHLEEVGARIPPGYTYQAGSAAGFAQNLSTGEPVVTQDAQGAYLLNWELGSPRPSVSDDEPVKTQTFYITGTASQSGHYAWVVASRTDVGAVGEITGTLYTITAIATRPEDSRTSAKIVADAVIRNDGTAVIMSWHVY